MSKIRIPTTMLIAGTSLTHLAPDDAIVSDPRVTPVSGDQIVSTETSSKSFELPPLDNGTQMPVLPEVDEKWSAKLERQFLRLAERKALGTLEPTEAYEFKQLSDLRMQLKVPRSGEDVLRSFQQRKLTHDIISALQRYVEFHATARSSKA